jgi:hypothetical protein
VLGVGRRGWVALGLRWRSRRFGRVVEAAREVMRTWGTAAMLLAPGSRDIGIAEVWWLFGMLARYCGGGSEVSFSLRFCHFAGPVGRRCILWMEMPLLMKLHSVCCDVEAEARR